MQLAFVLLLDIKQEWDLDFLVVANLYLSSIRHGKLGDCLLLWHAVVWCIWELRNGIVFDNKSADHVYILDRVKVLSWQWSSAGSLGGLYSFSDWCVDPINCLVK